VPPRGDVGQIAGMREARETLQELSRAVQTNVGKRSLKNGPAPVFVAAIKSRARVSSRANDPTPGSLRDSVKVGKSSSRRGQARQEIVAEDIAAVPNEYGLKHRNYPAQPFFRPGIDSARAPAAAALAGQLKVEVDGAARRAAKRGAK
jgi:hypothetical protein